MDWSGVAGVAGGIAGVAGVLVSARQKYRVDELAAAQAVITLKQQEIDAWKKKYDERDAEATRLLAENTIFNKLFSWKELPDPLKAAIDQLAEMVKNMCAAVMRLEALVKSETGKLEDDRR